MSSTLSEFIEAEIERLTSNIQKSNEAVQNIMYEVKKLELDIETRKEQIQTIKNQSLHFSGALTAMQTIQSVTTRVAAPPADAKPPSPPPATVEEHDEDKSDSAE